MSTIQILVNNGLGSGFQALDLPDDNTIKFSLYKSVQDFRDPLKATGAVSLPFTLPTSNRNKAIFLNDDEKQKLGKFKGTYQAQMILDNETLIEGELNVTKIKGSKKGFEVYIGQSKLENPRLGDIVSDKKLVELKSFKPLDFKGNLSIVNSWNNYGVYPGEEVVYPFVVRSFAAFAAQGAIGGATPIYTSGYESIGISHYCAAIVKSIFADAGYAVNGDIYNNETFLKMVMLYSNTEEQKWNYGALAPMKASCPPDIYSFGQVYAGGVKNTYERQSDMVQVLTYGWQAYDGDLCESLGLDGVYTCKYSGVYDIRVSATHAYNSSGNGSPSTGNGGFTVFRCISDDEFMPDTYLPTGANFGAIPALNTLDPGTLAVGGGSPFTFQVRLVAGKQYQVQRYIHFSTPITAGSNSFLCYNPNEGNFFITKCDGPLTVNPANFLPDMTQQAFLKGIFKLFNLYYQLNEQAKTVTIFGRDDFFQESLQDIVNLSPYLSVDAMDETPFTEAEVASIYVNWKNDESDYILNKTDYMDLVNGSTPKGATELPFAPIGFLEVEYSAVDSNSNVVTGVDMIPAIIPSTDNIDNSILTDVEAESQPGSWVPRLMLYERNTALKPNLTYDYSTKSNVKVALGRFYPGSLTGSGGYAFTEFPPKLTFFNINNQPFYKVDINQDLRQFALNIYKGDTIYNPASSFFLNDVNDVATLDNISLATNIDTVVNPKGFFFQLYGNDLLISDLSNYLQGVGRMDSVLWNKLTGRQVIRVGQDLFLLDSIANFDVNAKLATYKLYKLVSNISVVATPGSGGAVLYSSTMTATASCPTNTSGADKTSTATRSSYVSQAQADQLAYNAALQLATSQLVCTVSGFVGYGVAGAICANNSYGYETLGTATYVSQISQDDAYAQAYQLAYADAQSKLVCYISPLIEGNLMDKLVSTVMGILTPFATYADALAANYTDYTFYYADNQKITIGKPVYIRTQTSYYAVVDGYYAFKYTIGTNVTPCGFQIINGKVDNFIDSVRAGATAP